MDDLKIVEGDYDVAERQKMWNGRREMLEASQQIFRKADNQNSKKLTIGSEFQKVTKVVKKIQMFTVFYTVF